MGSIGDTQAAARWLERALRDRSGWLMFLPVEPEFEKVRQAPEVQRLLAAARPREVTCETSTSMRSSWSQ